MCCRDNTYLIHAPINVSQNEEKSASWMSKMKANAAYHHKSEMHTLKGIINPDKQVPAQWMEGKHDTSPWQHKTVTIRKILQQLVDEAGNKVFHAVNRVMLGPKAGSLQVATYRTLGGQQMALKIKYSTIAWVYHYSTSYCKLTVKCMDKIVSGCNFDECSSLTPRHGTPKQCQ
jgi:hypothetical protein